MLLWGYVYLDVFVVFVVRLDNLVVALDGHAG